MRRDFGLRNIFDISYLFGYYAKMSICSNFQIYKACGHSIDYTYIYSDLIKSVLLAIQN